MILHFSEMHDPRATWHVLPREGLQKVGAYRSNGRHCLSKTCRSHVHYPNLCAFVVFVPVGCRLHAPGTETFFDVGSSGLREL